MSDAVAAARLQAEMTELVASYRTLGLAPITAAFHEACRTAGVKRTRIQLDVAGAPAGFIAFWEAYPSHRRVDKWGCCKKWLAKGLEAHSEAILAAVHTQTASEDWQRDGGRYVPMTATYLNQRRWESVQAADASPFVGAL